MSRSFVIMTSREIFLGGPYMSSTQHGIICVIDITRESITIELKYYTIYVQVTELRCARVEYLWLTRVI